MSGSARAFRIAAALAVAALAFGLRWHAVRELPPDYDEPVYLDAAGELAAALRAGDLGALLETNAHPEHPQLAKLAFAALIAPSLEAPAETQRTLARRLAACLGALEVLLLAALSPLAGLFLAVHSYTVKYTSLVMLEALPSVTSLAALLCYEHYRRTARRAGWIASGVLLGLTAAGKYMYAVIGPAILADWCLALRSAPGGVGVRLRPVLAWGALALAVFLAANPYLWPDPLWRLEFSLFFHGAYSDEANVGGFPAWQPLVWLSTSLPQATAPGAPQPFLLRIDPMLSLLALVGLPRLWRRQRAAALWLVFGLVFLLVWNTKWPHYVLILAAPLCASAAEGARGLVAFARRRPAHG